RRVGREREHAPAPAGADDDGAGRDRLDLAGHELDGNDALHAAVVDEELRREPLVVPNDARVPERGLEQRMEKVEARFVRREPRAHLLHSTEGPHGHVTVALTAPRAPPVLEAKELLRS